MSRITGGGGAAPGEFPYAVSILLNGKHQCSGFIYSEMFIVTTASCVVTVTPGNPPYIFSKFSIAGNDLIGFCCFIRTVNPLPARQLSVIVGEYNVNILDDGEQEYPVIYVKAHEKYNPIDQLYNLAVLEVQQLTYPLFGKINKNPLYDIQ